MSSVIVIPYDPAWVVEFERSAAELAPVFGDNLIEVHHVGSTSVPGIYAKPVIDMIPVVKDIDVVDDYMVRMAALGYEARGAFGLSGRRYFPRNNAAGERSHQLHTYQQGSPEIDRHLAFRDFMRAHPEIAKQYNDLKRKLAEQHPEDIEAYMDGKDEFIQEYEKKALEWDKTRR